MAAQILAQYGSARVQSPFSTPKDANDANRRWAKIESYNQRIKDYVNKNAGKMPNPAELREFGSILFETLFPGAVRRLYDTARSLQRSERLNVILTAAMPGVSDKPWEFAYDPVRKTSLATADLHFLRNVMTAVPAEIIDDQERLRILVVSSQPLRYGALSIDEEEAVIRRGFEPLCLAGLADIEVLARATPASMHASISTGRFSVLHFIGHGTYDVDADKGYLIFQDDHGNPYPITDQSVGEIICGRGIRMVFLNACETGTSDDANMNSGVAPALVRGGVPIVIANQYKVLDTSATFFAQRFYWSMAQGLTLAESVREARISVNYSLSGEAIDWAVPVVYARDPNSRLCRLRPFVLNAAGALSAQQTGRRGFSRGKVKVAVWDANSRFPRLRSTIERLNGAQSFYAFEIVDLSLPVDSWYMYKGERYLDANKFSDRVAPLIPQLGVKYICVIADELMVCDTWARPPSFIYAWWPDEKTQPGVFIFSTKELNLPTHGKETDRAIVNSAVSAIAGYITGKDSHGGRTRERKLCPNYWNPDEDMDLLIGREKFCKPCRDHLKKGHAEELDALSKLLGAFD